MSCAIPRADWLGKISGFRMKAVEDAGGDKNIIARFVALNGQGMQFRQKRADKVIAELKHLLSLHPSRKICMVDNIIPINYFVELLPRLALEIPNLHIFYEQKANLTLEKVSLLKAAGVSVIQPGIEALSTTLLKLMRKGVSARQNVLLLKYARQVGLSLNWNMLYGFPEDLADWYRDAAALVQLIVHLEPPAGLFMLSIDRFSPYFDDASGFGIANVEPLEAYYAAFPSSADARKLAYHFRGQYKSESLTHTDALSYLGQEVARWKERWQQSVRPKLFISHLDSNQYILADTRSLPNRNEIEFIDREHALAAALGQSDTTNADSLQWAICEGICVELDNVVVPLALAGDDVLDSFTSANASMVSAT